MPQGLRIGPEAGTVGINGGVSDIAERLPMAHLKAGFIGLSYSCKKKGR
jgi:hypothetical protein